MVNRADKILFAEDELALAEIVKESLESRGFIVSHYDTAVGTFDHYQQHRPDILLLDVMLPDADGFALARQIRVTDPDIPIIFLTSRSLPQDVVTGFESGGNDYLRKPFSMEELIVRIRSLLNKKQSLLTAVPAAETLFTIGSYNFNYHMHKLFYDDAVTDLTSRENEILKLLFLNKNRVVARSSLLMHIWGNDDFTTGRSLDVFITKLRKYLQADGDVQIANVRGIGYKLIC
jgi:DNA-binding response OmpR family regulator